MSRPRFVSFAYAAFVFCVAFASAEGKESPPRPAFHTQLIGSWEINAEFNRLLGFCGGENRSDATFAHPSSFSLTLDELPGATIGAEKLSTYRDQIFRPMGHSVVATGKWTTKFDVDSHIETDCFVTSCDGSSFLWVGAPFVVLYGGSVALIHGIDQEHDALVVNFNSLEKDRTQDTVAYGRKIK